MSLSFLPGTRWENRHQIKIFNKMWIMFVIPEDRWEDLRKWGMFTHLREGLEVLDKKITFHLFSKTHPRRHLVYWPLAQPGTPKLFILLDISFHRLGTSKYFILGSSPSALGAGSFFVTGLSFALYGVGKHPGIYPPDASVTPYPNFWQLQRSLDRSPMSPGGHNCP